MIALKKHETLSLVFEKLMTIQNLCEEATRDHISIESMRHEIAQIKSTSERAMEIIDAFEPADPTTRLKPKKP